MNDFSQDLPEEKNLAELLNLAVGYQRAQVLFAFAELKIADLLQKKPLRADEISQNIKMNRLAAERFLNAAVAVGLLSKNGDFYENKRLTEQFLLSDAAFYLGGQIKRYSERSYPAWNDLTEHLQKWDYGNSENETPEDDDQGAEAMAEQHNLSLLHGHYLARAFDFSGYHKLLDLGGGTGAMSIGLCENYAHLAACVFDLPKNAETARKFVRQSASANRIECVGGNFQTDDLPENFDVALLANFMSVAEAAENKKLLRRIYEKLPMGGACLLSGLILDDSRLAPEKAVLFCLEDICWDAPDVERSRAVYAEWLAEAGFTGIESKDYLDATKLLYGFKRD